MSSEQASPEAYSKLLEAAADAYRCLYIAERALEMERDYSPAYWACSGAKIRLGAVLVAQGYATAEDLYGVLR